MIAHVEAPSVASGKQGQRDDLDMTDQQGWLDPERGEPDE